MKWAIFFLCLLGILAAACAALLVNGMRLPAAIESRIPKQPEDTTEVQVLLATRMIPAMTVVDSRLVIAKTMMKKDAPRDFISSTTDVVGKVLASPLVEGQPFTAACFAGDKGSRIVAEAIPRGKRAVGISVTDYAGLEGMLYPGSTVDVMASFKSNGGNDWRDSVTTTLLENIQVLGIEQQTVVSPGKTLGDSSNAGRTSRRVTLLVDTKQAKSLQLAMEHGTLSLALRNPMDDGQGNRDSVSVSRLLGIGNGTSVPVKNEFDQWFQMLAKAAATANARMDAAAKTKPPVVTSQDPFASGPTTRPAEPPPAPKWEVTIIRGETTSTQNFPMPATRPAEKDPEPANVEVAEPDAIKPVSLNR